MTYHSRKAINNQIQAYNYYDVFKYRRSYECCKESHYKVFLLKQLIRAYLEIRDFKNAFLYIDEYCNLYGDAEVKELRYELQELIKNIENKLKKRNQRDILIEWVDALPYEEYVNDYSNSFTFLKNEQEKSIMFNSAYSVCPYTRFTLFSILSGKLPIDDELYNKNCAYENMLSSIARRYKSRFEYVGPYLLKGNLGTQRIDTSISFPRPTVGQIQWEAIMKMLKSKDSLVLLLHNIAESHKPFYSGIMNTMCAEENITQRYAGYKYLDSQLEWYSRFYGDTSIIYMSDHGLPNIGKRIMCERRIHVLCMVKASMFSKSEVDKLFSLRSIHKIVKAILDKRFDETEITEELVEIQEYDYYGRVAIEKLIEKGKTVSINRHYWMQQRAVKGMDDLFIRYANGEEQYFLDNNEEMNQIGVDAYLERIAYLRNKCGSKFISYHSNSFFKYVERLYSELS